MTRSPTATPSSRAASSTRWLPSPTRPSAPLSLSSSPDCLACRVSWRRTRCCGGGPCRAFSGLFVLASSFTLGLLRALRALPGLLDCLRRERRAAPRVSHRLSPDLFLLHLRSGVDDVHAAVSSLPAKGPVALPRRLHLHGEVGRSPGRFAVPAADSQMGSEGSGCGPLVSHVDSAVLQRHLGDWRRHHRSLATVCDKHDMKFALFN